ncbi:hypothetical protein V1511DRAFT_492936 [Dipodascopsis uninucleata]
MIDTGDLSATLALIMSQLPKYTLTAIDQIRRQLISPSLQYLSSSPLLQPIISKVTESTPDLYMICVMLLVMWLSLVVLNMAVRMAYGLIVWLVRLVIIFSAIFGVLWVFIRGIDLASRDFGYAAGLLFEYVMSL